MKRFSLKKLNKIEGKEQYLVEVSNSFASLEDLDPRWILIVLGKLLGRISKFQPKRV
jgi:hypothetical protein